MQEHLKPDQFSVTIQGCWKYGEPDQDIPEYSGIYFLFEARPEADKAVPIRLLYVGTAENVREGILAFNHIFQPAKYVRYNNVLCYYTAAVEPVLRERVMAAFIYSHKPLANDRYKYKFPFAPTQVVSKGKTVFLKENFTV